MIDDFDPIVTIEQGDVRGKIGYDANEKDYYSFQGIPYAKPPIRGLRFKAPLPPDSWKGILDATEDGSECYSRGMLLKNMVGSENCLFINVFTPQLPKRQDIGLKPVMVWIYGGGFTAGSSRIEIYGPQFLLTEDVVVVTFNYRVGLLGFLSLEDASLGVPGNAGLKDMVRALKWVQKNISAFGGNPKNVTIFGQSAGAAAAHYLMLSPMAEGLFHRVIAQSGCALNGFARGGHSAVKLASAMGYRKVDEKLILRVLRKLPVDKILKIQEKLIEPTDVTEIRPYGPVVEKPSMETAFLLEEPIELIKSGRYNKVPFMTGYTSMEGMIVKLFSIQTGEKMKLITDFELAIPYMLNIPRGSKISDEIATKIKQFYYGNAEPSMKNLDIFYKLHSDNMFVRGIYDTVKNQAETSSTPIYLYRFSLETSLNMLKMFGNINEPGACHCDDLGYIFKNGFTPKIYRNSIEDISIKRIVKLWTTFARTGNPNPSQKTNLVDILWKPVEKNNIHFLDIGRTLSAETNPEAERMSFWDDIYQMLNI